MMKLAGVDVSVLVVSFEQIDGDTAVELEVLSHIILRRLYSIQLQNSTPPAIIFKDGRIDTT